MEATPSSCSANGSAKSSNDYIFIICAVLQQFLLFLSFKNHQKISAQDYLSESQNL